MNNLSVNLKDAMTIMSAFEKLIFVGRYNLTQGDAYTLKKVIHTIDKKDLKTISVGYKLLFEQLKKFEKHKITCVAEFRLGSSRYTKHFYGETEDEITDLINEEIEKKNSHYLSSTNI